MTECKVAQVSDIFLSRSKYLRHCCGMAESVIVIRLNRSHVRDCFRELPIVG